MADANIEMEIIMKSLVLAVGLSTPLFLLPAFGFANTNPPSAQAPREIMVGVNEAYIPGGFDSTSEAYVVVSGVYQNGCYSWSRAEVNHTDAFHHEIKTFANVNPGMCIMVFVPYQKEVRLGQLASGEHTLRFLGGDGTYLEKSFKVE